MHYHSKVCLKLNLNSSQSEDLHKFFYEHVNNSLASDDCVSYDSVEGEIITIMGLKYEDNRFYIQSRSEQSRPEGIRVKQRIFTSIDEFVHAQAANESVKKAQETVAAACAVDVRNPQLPDPQTSQLQTSQLQLQPSQHQLQASQLQTSQHQLQLQPQEKTKVKIVIKKKLNPDN